MQNNHEEPFPTNQSLFDPGWGRGTIRLSNVVGGRPKFAANGHNLATRNLASPTGLFSQNNGHLNNYTSDSLYQSVPIQQRAWDANAASSTVNNGFGSLPDTGTINANFNNTLILNDGYTSDDQPNPGVNLIGRFNHIENPSQSNTLFGHHALTNVVQVRQWNVNPGTASTSFPQDPTYGTRYQQPLSNTIPSTISNLNFVSEAFDEGVLNQQVLDDWYMNPQGQNGAFNQQAQLLPSQQNKLHPVNQTDFVYPQQQVSHPMITDQNPFDMFDMTLSSQYQDFAQPFHPAPPQIPIGNNLNTTTPGQNTFPFNTSGTVLPTQNQTPSIPAQYVPPHNPAPAPAPINNNPTFLCTHHGCNKGFNRAYEQNRHMGQVHPNANQRLYFCHIAGCDKSVGVGEGYKRRDKLKEHMWKRHGNLGFVKSR